MDTLWGQVSSYIGKYIDLKAATKFITDHKVLILASSSAVLYGIYFLRRPKNLPPGPYGFPVIGSLLEFNNVEENMNRFREKYGDVFTLWLGGNNYTVILNSFDAIKEAFVSRGGEFANRGQLGLSLTDIFKHETIFNTEYNATYKVSRKIASQSIRKLLSTRLDELYGVEIKKLDQYVKESGGSLDIHDPINLVFANTCTGFLLNKSYSYDDKEFYSLRKNIERWMELMVEIFTVDVFDGPLKETREFEEIGKILIKLFCDHMDELNHSDEHHSDEHHSEPRDVMEAYINAGQFTPDQITATVFMLSLDSIHTSSNMCCWLFAYLLNYSKYQEMILQEINDVVGGGSVSVSHRPKMPVTESFIVEVLRIKTVFAIGVSNKALKDTTLLGYSIPKHVSVAPNYYAVNRDPQNYPEPELFKPERFIRDGKIGNMETFISFELGRRMCVGESIVRNNLFMFLTNMIQKYQITSASENPPSLDKTVGTFCPRPQPFSVLLTKRCV